jgi:hypothetical protein
MMVRRIRPRVGVSQWKPRVTTKAVIDAMNAFDEEPVAIVAEPAINLGAPVPHTPIVEQVPEVPVPVLVNTAVVVEPVGVGESGSVVGTRTRKL